MASASGARPGGSGERLLEHGDRSWDLGAADVDPAEQRGRPRARLRITRGLATRQGTPSIGEGRCPVDGKVGPLRRDLQEGSLVGGLRREAERLFGPSDRLVRSTDGQRPLAGDPERVLGGRGELVRLGADPARAVGGEVVGRDRAGGVGVVERREVAGRTQVAGAAGGAREGRVGDLADERMHEAVGQDGRGARTADADEELPRDEVGEAFLDDRRLQAAHRGEGGRVEADAEDGGILEKRAVRRAGSVEARGDELAEGVRDRDPDELG